MAISLKDLLGYHIHATDGELGKIHDIFFDDKEWKVRYFVVELGDWLDCRKVILSPISVKTTNPSSRSIEVALTKDQVKNSPAVDTEKTMTMQMEAETLNYYRWPLYWTDVGIWGTSTSYSTIEKKYGKTANGIKGSTHLRSLLEVIGYYIQSTDKKFGKVEDIRVKVGSWNLESFIAKTRRWLPSKSVELNVDTLRSIVWENGEFLTSMSSSQIHGLPKFNGSNVNIGAPK